MDNKKEYTLNKVEGFNPYDYIENATDKDGKVILREDGKPLQFLSTAAKIFWFRMVYPKGTLKSTAVRMENSHDAIIVRYKAEVRIDSTSDPIAEWQHQESVFDPADFDLVASRVQTIALGKALSKAGFGCEIELKLGIVENDTVMPVPAEESSEAPKKKRGRPKKQSDEEINDEVAKLLDDVDACIQEPKETEVTPTEDKLEEALNTVIIPTDKANIAISKLQGKTLKEAMVEMPTICNIISKRDNLKESVTPDVLEAAKYIAENMK